VAEAYGQTLVELAARRPDIVVLDGDLAADCRVRTFEEKYPDRFIENGIAEQDMVSMAGGLARTGLLPVVNSFASFLASRANEQIYNNATERTKIIYVGSLAGLLPSGPGHSHQSIRDLSALGSVPGLVMVEPSCEDEVGPALEYCVQGTRESCYLRLVSIPCHIPYRLPVNYRMSEGRGVALTEGDDAVLFGYGPVLLSQAFEAAAILREERGIGLTVVNLPWLNRVDEHWLRETVGECRHVFTLDDHYVAFGQGQMLAARLASLGLPVGTQIRQLGLTELPACGANGEALSAHELDAASLAKQVSMAVERERLRA
jgi:transketolase